MASAGRVAILIGECSSCQTGKSRQAADALRQGGRPAVVAGDLRGPMSLPADQRTRSCATELVCPDCGTRAPLTDTTFRCPHCDKGLDIDYDYERAREPIAELGPETRPLNIWRYEELLPIVDLGRLRAGRRLLRPHPADPRRPARRRARPEQPLHQGRLDQPALALLQGPGGQHGRRPRARAGLHGDRLRLDRQRRHRDRRARRQGRPAALHLLPGQPRAGQGPRLPRARRRGLPARRQLRPGQPGLPRAAPKRAACSSPTSPCARSTPRARRRSPSRSSSSSTGSRPTTS